MAESPILVTGGAGFIGSNFVLEWIAAESSAVVNLDKLTYAGNLANLAGLEREPRHVFVRGDIADGETVARLLERHRPRAIVNFAAESHVDRSIHGPADFVQTNIVGTFTLLETTRSYWSALPAEDRAAFRFLHVSTDEVYGSLAPQDPPFTEASAYGPNSPYAASKAASDHLVRSYFHTYGLPTITTNCSNNYGPYQFPEKLIPLMIVNALGRKALPVYGDGSNVRDWLYVADHCEAVRLALARGRPGETYNIGGNAEKTEPRRRSLDLRDTRRAAARPALAHRSALITYVPDRPGHDRRYAIDSAKIRRELGWRPREDFGTGLSKTVKWYLDNMSWVENVMSGSYRDWMERNYENR